jgi:hypothetical protein
LNEASGMVLANLRSLNMDEGFERSMAFNTRG